MSRTKGPTFAQAAASQRGDEGARRVEVREFEAYGYTSRVGRSSCTIVCPFCRARVEAFLWSLSGGGKRCECGAAFGSSSNAYHWAKQEPQDRNEGWEMDKHELSILRRMVDLAEEYLLDVEADAGTDRTLAQMVIDEDADAEGVVTARMILDEHERLDSGDD